jgi:SAM-dependent methyltransferase
MKEHTMKSENASDHWPFLDVKDQVVLDLGCGMWYTVDINENSSVYFNAQGAKQVIGVDSNPDTLKVITDAVGTDDSYIFIHAHITSADHIKSLLTQYNITVIKCDIEGDEIAMKDLTSEDMKNIQEITIEYHSINLRLMLLDKMIEWGFNMKSDVHMGNVYTNHPQGILHYSRNGK